MKKNDLITSVTEGSTEVLVFKNKELKKGPGSKEDVPFYNPSMELNRDFSVVFCQWFLNNKKEKLRFLDGLAASGIRGLRLANELKGNFEVTINDWNKNSYDLIEKNVKHTKLKDIKICNQNLNTLLSENKYDYVDIDPFGSPVYFFDSAMRGIRHNGVISCTATDTATLNGVYPEVCIRRYSANPFHGVVMKEVGLRILLGCLCREAARYDKAIDPLVCYTTDYYFRVYIRVRNGVKRSNDSIEYLKLIKNGEPIGIDTLEKDVGPLWIGKLQNKRLIQNLRTILFDKKLGTKNTLWQLLDLLEEEADGSIFFYTTDSLASIWKRSPPKIDHLLKSLEKMGYDVNRTHFGPTSFKTNAPTSVIKDIYKG